MADRREPAGHQPGTANGARPTGSASSSDRARVLLLECRLEQMRSALDAARSDADRARVKLAEATAREANHARRHSLMHEELAEARAEVAALHRRLEHSEALRAGIEGNLFAAPSYSDGEELVRLRREALAERERGRANEVSLARLRGRVEELLSSRETVLARVSEWQRLMKDEGTEAVDLAEFISELRREILDLERRTVEGEHREAALREELARVGSRTERSEVRHGDAGEEVPVEVVEERGEAATAVAETSTLHAETPAPPPRVETPPPFGGILSASAGEGSAPPEQRDEPDAAESAYAPGEGPGVDGVVEELAEGLLQDAVSTPAPEPVAEAPVPAPTVAAANPAPAVAASAASTAPTAVKLEPPATAWDEPPVGLAPIPASTSPERRVELLLRLGRSGSAEAIQTVLAHTLAEEGSVRAAAYEAIGRMLDRDPSSAVAYLNAGLADRDSRVRRRVVLAVASLRGVDLRALLGAMLEDGDPQVRRVVREVLRHVRPARSEAPSPPAPPSASPSREAPARLEVLARGEGPAAGAGKADSAPHASRPAASTGSTGSEDALGSALPPGRALVASGVS